MTAYRFLDGLGDVVAEREFDDHAAAIRWAKDGDASDDTASDDTASDDDDEVQRVEYRGPEGDWRWAGPLEG